jgi:hypothetical protein
MGAVSGISALLLPIVELGNRISKFPVVPAIRVLLSKPIRPVYIGSALALIGLNIFYTLSPSYLKELNFSTVQVGLILNFAVLIEIMFMPFTKRYIDKFGIKIVIFLAILAVVLRLVVLSTWTITPIILLVQSLHAPTIIGFYVAGTMYIISKATGDSQFSIQGLYSGTMLGLTRVIAMFMVMTVFKFTNFENLLNIKILFLLGGVIALIGAVFLMWDGRKVRKQLTKES